MSDLIKAGLTITVFLTITYIAIAGYIYNLLNLISYENLELSGTLILQLLGIFMPPLGIFMGWII